MNMFGLGEGKVPINSLLYKEWKQRQTLLLLTAGFLLIIGPLAIINEYFHYKDCLSVQSERSGHFILSKHTERIFQVLVMVISMLGSAGVCGYAYNGSYSGYIFGMLIGAVIGFFISYYFIYKKTKQI